MIDSYTTGITPSKTVADMTKLLAKNGAQQITTDYGDDGEPTGLSFVVNTEYGWRAFAVPIRAEGVQRSLIRDKVPRSYTTMEHAKRVAWRVALKWLQAQLALIDAGMARIDEVLFPWMLTGGGQESAYAVYREKQMEAIEQ